MDASSSDPRHPPKSVGRERARYIPTDGSISEPPKFAADAYGEFSRNLRFWKEATSLFGEGQLVAKLAMRSGGALKIILIRYLKETPKEPWIRSVQIITQRLGEEFPRPNTETVIQKINELMNISRRSEEDIQLFRIRFGEAKMAVELSETALPDTVLYRRALQALKLSGTNRAVRVISRTGSARGDTNSQDFEGCIDEDFWKQLR